MGAKDILVITTDGTAVISDITLDAIAITNISSVFVSSLPGLKVALWLIIVSIVLGLLLLTLLIYGLMRVFKSINKHYYDLICSKLNTIFRQDFSSVKRRIS